MCMKSRQQPNTDSQQQMIDATYVARELDSSHWKKDRSLQQADFSESKQPNIMQRTVFLPDWGNAIRSL